MGGAFIRGNGGGTDYKAFEVELRRNMSHGVYFRTSYTFGRAYEWDRFSMRSPFQKRVNTGSEGSVTHALKLYGIWELPLGKDKRFFGGSSGLLDRIIGGWQIAGTTRVQSGRMLVFGNVRLVGMSRKEFQKSFRLRFDDAGKAIYMLPQDIIDNTLKAFGVSATSPTGYGSQGPPSGRYLAPANGPDCIELVDPNLIVQNPPTNNPQQFGFNFGPGKCGEGSLVVTGPRYWTTDLSLVKKIKLKGNTTIDFRAELLNAFNHPNFVPVTGGGTLVGYDNRAGTAPGGYTSQGSYLLTNSTDPVYAPRIAQMVLRISF
jgi:hypothetical protein